MHIAVEGMQNEEIFRIQMRGVNKLIRGFARFKTEDKTKQESAVQDVADAIADFQTIGLNNEITWLAETFLYIKQGNTEQAIQAISKLEGSQYVGEHERMALTETRGALANRDPDTALSIITDKIIMLNIGMNYARAYLLEIQWAKLLEKTSVGRRLLKVFPEMMENYNKAKKYLDLEVLANKGKQLLK